MIPMKAFEALVGFITGNRAKITAEHEEFMHFYSELIKILPDELAREFGRISAPTWHKGQKRDYQLELTVTDLMWWQTVVDDGGRFVEGALAVQREVWDHMNKSLRHGALTDEQKLQLLNIINEGE